MSSDTKKLIAESLKTLMNHRSFEKITVKDVVKKCGINRQTFYYHFQDIYDLLSWIYKTEALDTLSNFRTYDTWQQGFLKIFQYVQANKTFCLNTFHSIGREHLEQFLYNAIFDLVLGIIDELSENSSISKENKEFVSSFYSYAFIGLLLNWLKSDMKKNPEDIINNLNKLIDGDIARAINKYRV